VGELAFTDGKGTNDKWEPRIGEKCELGEKKKETNSSVWRKKLEQLNDVRGTKNSQGEGQRNWEQRGKGPLTSQKETNATPVAGSRRKNKRVFQATLVLRGGQETKRKGAK